MTEAEEKEQQRRNLVRGFIAAGCAVLVWSGFNIISRMGGKSALTPFDIVALRFGISGLLMFPVLLRRPAIMNLRTLIISAIGGLGYNVSAYNGFVFAPAAHAGILVNGGIPFATVLFAWMILGARPNRQVVLAISLTAIGIGIIGARSLMLAGVSSERWWLGDLFFIIATLCWSVYGVMLRKWQMSPIDAIAATTVGSGAVFIPVYLLFLPKAITLVPLQQIALQGIYQGVVVALGMGYCYVYAVQNIGPVRTALMTAMVPAITAAIAIPLLGEPLEMATVLGLLCVTVGAIWGAVANASPSARKILKDAADCS